MSASNLQQHGDADNDETVATNAAAHNGSETLPSLVVLAGDLQVSHRKRLAMILRYLANMHRSAGQADCFVRTFGSAAMAKDALSSEFFVPSAAESTASTDDMRGKVIFALSDFRSMPPPEAGLFSSPPFSFYAASGGSSDRADHNSSLGGTSGVSVSWEPISDAGESSSRGRKREGGGQEGNASSNSGRWTVSAWSKSSSVPRRHGGFDDMSTASCWLRLTRIKAEEPPPATDPSVSRYLEAWAERRGVRPIRRLLHDLESLEHAPALDPSTPERKQQEIKSFLRKYRRHLRRDAVRKAMEPLYNCLFDLAQRTKSADSADELVWGFGSARMVLGDNEDGAGATVVNGPLLEVRVEVELAPDGALLIRPCEHTGVELNREVLAALLATDDGMSRNAGAEVLAKLHRAVSEMETKYLSPAQPSTYAATLKRMAVELCSGGRFVPSSKTSSSSSRALTAIRGSNKLLVTDSWCVYHRPKPSSVWARDAQILAELITKSSTSAVGSPPRAALSITHGPNALTDSELNDTSVAGRVVGSLKSLLSWVSSSHSYCQKSQRPLFPLPTSNSQDRIHQLLSNGAAAVVVEGPPGSGKTHSIANIVCSYLAQGKRVLVTSKGAPALSVLRQRLPECMQELCVDATVSEASGMQQLQQTVERLAFKVSCGVDKSALCESLEGGIEQLEKDIAEIDEKLEQYHERRSALLRRAEGQELIEFAFFVVEKAPWMAATIAKWTALDSKHFLETVETLVNERDQGFDEVNGYNSPPCERLISGVSAKAGMTLPSLTGKFVRTIAAVPIVGPATGAQGYRDDVESYLEEVKVFGEAPTTQSHWNVALRAITHDYKHWRLYDDSVSNLVEREGWPRDAIYDETKERLSFSDSFIETLRKASRVKELQHKLVAGFDLDQAQESQRLEVQRSKMVARLQDLDGKLVEAKVMTKLSQMFSPSAQSALIKFAQLAGKAKFKSNAQFSRLSQRQQRHRQEYLKAFEQCVRYIPCWILTTNQVNDYLPAEFGLFDLCIIDEASQSDITALPSMLRGKQWLVVGDGKQVSPTEGFVSEDQIDSLRVSLPDSPFRASFLPGNSFFDLCAQAFPVGRVVLSEHFRCAPEIIMFSNAQYYQDRLHPLRLPTSTERMSPSLVDIFLPNGRKVGKINENECRRIVEMIEAMIKGSEGNGKGRPKSIGVICLIGDEQSRLIRGRLLDAIGPEKYNRHDILIGEPPAFQGSERDVVFLSMVSSPGSVPTQSQLMHHQRINVAMSRAKDRLVLVRSIGRSHIPSSEDVKVPVIEFFSEYGSKDLTESDTSSAQDSDERHEVVKDDMAPLRDQCVRNLSTSLRKSGYTVTPMGVVWKNAICVENGDSGTRAAVAVEGCCELKEDWATTIAQQRSIERVGWQCLRVDALSWMLDHRQAVTTLEMFLKSAGVGKPVLRMQDEIAPVEGEEENNINRIPMGDANVDHASDALNNAVNEEVQESAPVVEMEEEAPIDPNRPQPQRANASLDDVVVISSNDDEDYIEVSSNASSFAAVKDEDDEDFQPNQYGDVVNLEIVGSEAATSSGGSRMGHSLNADSSESESASSRPDKNRERRKRSLKRKNSDRSSDEEDYHGDESEGVDDNGVRVGRTTRRKRSKRRRLDAYSRDGRWYPGYAPKDEGDDEVMDAEEEEWEDLKDVVSDSSESSWRDGSPSGNLRDRSSSSLAGPSSQRVGNSEEQPPSGSDDVDFHDCQDHVDQGDSVDDVKQETTEQDTAAPNPGASGVDQAEASAQGKSDPGVISLL